MSTRTLVDRVLAAPPGTVVSIVAPAGSGKSTLLDEVRAAQPSHASLSLRSHHDEPDRFASALLEAISHTTSDVSGTGLAAAAEASIALLTRSGGPSIFVIDDLHVIEDRTVLDAVSQIAWTSTAVVVVASRRSPPIGLARLKVRRRLIEIGERDLALRDADARALVAAIAPDIDVDAHADEINAIGGWPAGLILYAMATRRDTPNAVAVQRLNADVQAFVREEILAGLPPDLRAFVLELGVIGSFDQQLARTVTGRADTVSLMDEIMARRLFLERDRSHPTWLAFHDLFGAAIRREAVVLGDERRRDLERRLVDALADIGEMDRAVDRMLALTDPAFVTEMISRHRHHTVWGRGSGTGLARLMARIPVEDMAGDQMALRGALFAAILVLDVTRATEVRAALNAITPWDHETRDPGQLPVEGLYSYLTWDGDQALAAYRLACERLAAAGWVDSVSDYLAHVGYAAQLYLSGQPDDAEREARWTLAQSARAGSAAHLGLLHALLGLIADEAGDHAAAVVAAERAAEATAERASPIDVPFVNVLRMRVERAAGNPDEARRIGVATTMDPDSVFSPALGLALIDLAETERELGHDAEAFGRVALVRPALERSTGLALMHQRLALFHRGDDPDRVPLVRSMPSALSEREQAILRLLHSRLTRREIGDELYLSVNTIKTHTQSIYRKLGVRSRNELIATMASQRSAQTMG